MTSWRENNSAWLTNCWGNPPFTGGFPSQRASDAELWYIFVRLNKLLNNQSHTRWYIGFIHFERSQLFARFYIITPNPLMRGMHKYCEIILTGRSNECHGVLIVAIWLFIQQTALVSNEEIMYVLHYWPFIKRSHRWPMDSPHKGPVMRKKCHIITSSWKSCMLVSCHTTNAYTLALVDYVIAPLAHLDLNKMAAILHKTYDNLLSWKKAS